jgi:hypothetical protein
MSQSGMIGSTVSKSRCCQLRCQRARTINRLGKTGPTDDTRPSSEFQQDTCIQTARNESSSRLEGARCTCKACPTLGYNPCTLLGVSSFTDVRSFVRLQSLYKNIANCSSSLLQLISLQRGTSGRTHQASLFRLWSTLAYFSN